MVYVYEYTYMTVYAYVHVYTHAHICMNMHSATSKVAHKYRVAKINRSPCVVARYSQIRHLSYRALFWKLTCKNKASYETLPPLY